MVLLCTVTACDSIKPVDPIDSISHGSQDYIPLAIGNKWEYTHVYTAYGRTPNGSYTDSRTSYTIQFITAAKRTSDTTDEFTCISTYRSRDWKGDWGVSYDTIKIQRTPNSVWNLSPRTGADNILTKVIYPGPGYAKYKKGVGFIESTTSGYFHITAGNQGDYTSTTTLTNYTVK